MASLPRMLLLAAALLSSGVLQVAQGLGDDACCSGEAEEQDAPCPDCPPGIACACCPIRGAVQAATVDLAPASAPGVAVATAAAEPSAGDGAADIFHPPRA